MTEDEIEESLQSLGFTKNDSKVFCIGDVKTGTTTLSKALSILGYRSIQLIKRKEEL